MSQINENQIKSYENATTTEFLPLIADSRMIALIACKKNFNPVKERRLIEKAKSTNCKCKHYTGTDPCFYRNCRHTHDRHYGSSSSMVL